MSTTSRDPRSTYLVVSSVPSGPGCHRGGETRVKAYAAADVRRAYPGAVVRLLIDGNFDGLKNMSLKSPEVVA